MAKDYESKVKSIGIICKVDKPFDEALETITHAGAKVITARDLAYARIQEGRDSSLCSNGSYVKEGLVYVPDKTLFIRNSPLLNPELAGKAVQSHRNGSEFYIDEKLIKKYEEQAENDKNKIPSKKRVLSLSKRGNFSIPTDRFNEDELTLWLFKDQAEAYGDFLRENNLSEMPVYLSDNSKKNFANQLWLGSLGGGSELDGGRLLDCGSRVRGVLRTGEASSQPKKSDSEIKLLYTPKQKGKIIEIIQEVREGKKGTSQLEKAIKFLEGI